ncbi:MAG TPA: ORF6N domain-containing protein [Candidatus Methanoperedens sp.]|nr:ORF6N domain-containing protein [Candidatus Methanoperedens sp.]
MSEHTLVPVERIERAILMIRGHKVLLDADLAALYGVETKTLNRAVKRNIERFPADFMFQLSEDEAANLRHQFGTSSEYGGRRYFPYAFTEKGVAMLSSVLRSPRAVRVNIEIMRAFVRLRQMLQQNADLARKLAALERKYDTQFKVVTVKCHLAVHFRCNNWWSGHLQPNRRATSKNYLQVRLALSLAEVASAMYGHCAQETMP